jgi:uncharacterized tellurite resistance protein B-like protein
MPTQSSQSAVLDDLIQEMGAGDIDISEAIKLSPPLVQAACLLYTMASDGKIQEQESSQLQQVIGGNDGLLAHALAYVKAFPVEKFLEDAPSVLSQRDKLCIMANVCDSMLSDGNADIKEIKIFETFREAFDLQKSEINHIIDTVTLKNNKNIFGEFELITTDKLSDITPHLAMAVSIVYMMSADGNIGQEEIGQLETMIGEFEGLQQYALQFVRKVKRSDFLSQAKLALDKQQRLCVLLNVCDSMMSDESVGMLEDKLFMSMLDAFSVKESAFKKYYEVLELKNIKPFDVSDFEYCIEHIRTLSQQEQKGIVVEGLDEQSEVGVGIQRTMDSNTEKVTNDFGSSDDIHKVQENATHELEKQRFLEIKVDPNLQKVLGGSDSDKNIQAVNGSSSSAILKTSPLDDRVENLQKVLDELSQKLNKFETKNKSLLNNVRANTNKESSRDPAFENQDSKANKTRVANEAVKDNLQSLASQKVDEVNKATVAKEAIKDNKQAIASSQTLVNKAAVAKEPIQDNKQAIASSAVAANKAGVAKEAIEDNLQSIAVNPVNSNDASVAKVGFSSNRQAVNNGSQILDASIASNPADDAPVNTSDALEISSAGVFASQTEIDPNQSSAETQIKTSAAVEAPITFKKRQSPLASIFRNNQPSKYSFKFYARVLATFFVMSLWTSNIAATRLDMGSMVFGHLTRFSADQLDLR